MIPFDFITEWRQVAPWIDDTQVEQDLILSRAVVEMFSQTEVASSLAFRGGTALFKLFLAPAPRYSEDIDLVQVKLERPKELIQILSKDHKLAKAFHALTPGRPRGHV